MKCPVSQHYNDAWLSNGNSVKDSIPEKPFLCLGRLAPSLFLQKFFIDSFYSNPSDCYGEEFNSPPFSGLHDKDSAEDAAHKPSSARSKGEIFIAFGLLCTTESLLLFSGG